MHHGGCVQEVSLAKKCKRSRNGAEGIDLTLESDPYITLTC